MLERTDVTTNEVLVPITFVLAYPTVFVYNDARRLISVRADHCSLMRFDSLSRLQTEHGSQTPASPPTSKSGFFPLEWNGTLTPDTVTSAKYKNTWIYTTTSSCLLVKLRDSINFPVYFFRSFVFMER